MDPPVRKVVAEIVGIQWMTHDTASSAAELYDTGGFGVLAYPDAATPGGPARPIVDVRVQVAPQLAGIPVALKWFDVDDPSAADAPIDDDPAPPNPLRPDEHRYDPGDNRATTGSVPGISQDALLMGADLPESEVTDANGTIRVPFEIGWIQPGNNFRVVAGARPTDLTEVFAVSDDPYGSVYHEENFDLIHNEGEPTLTDAYSIDGMMATRLLTVWRRLHVEVDSMGAVTGNTVSCNISRAEDNGNNGYNVTFDPVLTQDDLGHFVGGVLTDSAATSYLVLSCTGSTAVVLKGLSPPPASGLAELSDDDHLTNGQDVPMPDTSQLYAAMQEAFVEVAFDVGDSNDNTPFKANLNSVIPDMHDVRGWDSVTLNAVPYWVAYVLGAFQGPYANDNDPESETDVILGETDSTAGGCYIYIESIYDTGDSQADTVVHEVGHAVGNDCWTEPVTLRDQGQPCVYTDEYLDKIRSSRKPLGLPLP
jgi:hypothetical protein